VGPIVNDVVVVLVGELFEVDITAVALKQLQALVRLEPPVVPTYDGIGKEFCVRHGRQKYAAYAE